MSTFKTNQENAKLITNIQNQEPADTGWIQYQAQEDSKLVDLKVVDSSTTSELHIFDYVKPYNKLAIYNSTDGTKLVDASLLRTDTAFYGYPTEFDYFNKWHKHNILHDQLLDNSGWTTDTNTLPGNLQSSQAIVTKSRVYLLGGTNDSAWVNVIYYADIDSNGYLGSWSTDTNTLPGNLGKSQAIVTKSRVYLLGGYNGSATTNVIYYTDIDSNGYLGSWSTDTNTLPGNLYGSQAIVTKSRVYLLGGNNGSAYTNVIYYADIDSNGYLGSWSTDTNTLPGNLGLSQAIVTKSRAYLLGNHNDSSATNVIYYADIDSNGYLGSWSTDTNTLPGNLDDSQAVVTKSRVYLLGGYNSSAYTNVIYYADIDSNGYLSSWSTDTNILPGNLAWSQAIVTKSRVYLLGGYNGSTTNVIYYVPFTGWEIPKNGYYAECNQYDISSASLTASPTKAFQVTVDIDLHIDSDNTTTTNLTIQTPLTTTQNYIDSININSTASQPIISGDTLILNNNIKIEGISIGSKTIETDNPYKGYPCEFDYFNRWHRHNILHDQLLDNSGWSTDTNTLPGNLYASQAIVTKSRVYLLGGYDGSAWLNSIYYSDIDSNGYLGSWSTDTNTLPGNLSNSQAIVTKSRVYLFNGFDGSAGTNKVYYADIDSNGYLGSWSTDTNTLPGALNESQAIVTKSRVYLLGGYNTNAIYYADIDSNGYLGAWSTDSNTLPGNLDWSKAVVTKSRVYLLGGDNGSATNVIYYAGIDSDGYLSSWSTDTNTLPGNLSASQAVVTKSRVYLLGGDNGSATNVIYYADIDSNGYLSSWSTDTNTLPGNLSRSQAIVTKSRVYLLGGYNGSAGINTIYYAPFTGWEIPKNGYYAQDTLIKYNIDISTGSLTNPPTNAYAIQPRISISLGTNEDEANIEELVLESDTDKSSTTSFYSLYYYPLSNSKQGVIEHVGSVDLDTGNGVSVSSITKNDLTFTGYPCEFDYFNKWHKHNILHDQLLDNSGWTTDTNTLPGNLAYSQAIVTKSRVYLLGGNNGSYTNIIYYANIDSNGYLGAWSTDTNTLPGNLGKSQAIVTKSRVYLLGGDNGSATTNVIYYADIDSNGYLGFWSTDTNTLPGNLDDSQAVVTKSRVYLLGGDGTNIIYYADIDSNGYLGSWSIDTNTLPGNLGVSQAIVTKSRVYLLGGDSTNIIYYTDIDSNGYLGSWSTDTNTLPGNLGYSQAVVTKSRVFLLGGETSHDSGYTNVIYYATIDSNGYLGAWSTDTNTLPGNLAAAQAVVTKSRVYLLANRDGDGLLNTIYYAPFTGWEIPKNGYRVGINYTLAIPTQSAVPTKAVIRPNRYTNETIDSISYSASTNTLSTTYKTHGFYENAKRSIQIQWKGKVENEENTKIQVNLWKS